MPSKAANAIKRAVKEPDTKDGSVQSTSIERGLRALAARKEGEGFRARDLEMGTILAKMEKLSAKEERHAQKMLLGYEKTLPPELFLAILNYKPATNAKVKIIELNKSTADDIPENYIGTPTFVRSVYDYTEINGRPLAFFSRFGTVGIPMLDANGNKLRGPDGKPTVKPVDIWIPRYPREYTKDETTRISNPTQTPVSLLHFPELHEYLRNAKMVILFLKIRAGIESRVKFESEDHLNAVSLWALGTHFHRVFDHYPILDFVKVGYNAGGSVALKSTLAYCARPKIVQSPTEASLFRTADDLRPTIGIEEFTSNMNEDVRKAVMQLLDGSFDKGVFISRVDKHGVVRDYDFYGPRALVDPHGLLAQYSTASRSLVIPMVKVTGFQSDDTRLWD